MIDLSTTYMGLKLKNPLIAASSGLTNPIRDCKKQISIPVLASVNCVTAEKWPYYVTTLQEAGADRFNLLYKWQGSDRSDAG